MSGRWRRFAGGVCTLLGVAAAEAQEPGPRAFVLDQTARTVTMFDIATARAAQTGTVQGTPTMLLKTADGRRLLVLERGEGRDAGDKGYQAKTRSAVTILDGRTLAVEARIELGWGLDRAAMLSSSGDRLSVLCPGFQGRTPAESLSREILTVDLAAGTLMSRVELPRPVSALLATPDGRTAVLLSSREDRKNTAPLPAELRFVDLTAGSIAAAVPLEGDPGGPVLAPDGQFLYLLDRGKPNNNPDKNVNGRLHAVSMATRTVERVTDVGSKPRGLVLDERGQQLLMVSDGPPVKGPANRDRAGELRVIRGAGASAPIPVGTGPERLEVSADGRTLYVLGTYSVASVTLPDLRPAAPLTFKTFGEELRVSPDGTRLYMVNGEYFWTFDLGTGARLAEVRTGRMGMKMLLALEAGLEAETARLNAENAARRDGRLYYAYTEYSLTAPRGTMAVRPDGKAVYALNSQTSDVTVIDGVSGAILEKVPAGGFAVLFLPAASVALVPSAPTVHAVDLTTHQKQADVVTDSTGNFDRAELSPDSRLAVIHGSGGVLFVNAASGRPVGTFKPFGRVAGVVVDWSIAR